MFFRLCQKLHCCCVYLNSICHSAEERGINRLNYFLFHFLHAKNEQHLLLLLSERPVRNGNVLFVV